jgi:Tetratricopeptide repeat
MRLTFWFARIWPGFAQVWLLGRWEGLALAAAFAAALNLALVATFVWPQSWGVGTSPWAATGGWIAVVCLWTWGWRWLRRDWPRLVPAQPGVNPKIETGFREAQHAYLRGHWLEVESELRRMLDHQPGDVEALLLLASVQRRTHRWNEAKQTLNDLKIADKSARWLPEIEGELTQIATLEEEARKHAREDEGNAEVARAA